MPDAFKKLYQGQPSDTAATLYTVPGATQTIVKHIRVVNPTGADHTISLWHDGTTDAYAILPAATILAGGWGEFDGTIIMEAADTLAGKADTSSTLTVTVYGDEVTA